MFGNSYNDDACLAAAILAAAAKTRLQHSMQTAHETIGTGAASNAILVNEAIVVDAANEADTANELNELDEANVAIEAKKCDKANEANVVNRANKLTSQQGH